MGIAIAVVRLKYAEKNTDIHIQMRMRWDETFTQTQAHILTVSTQSKCGVLRKFTTLKQCAKFNTTRSSHVKNAKQSVLLSYAYTIVPCVLCKVCYNTTYNFFDFTFFFWSYALYPRFLFLSYFFFLFLSFISFTHWCVVLVIVWWRISLSQFYQRKKICSSALRQLWSGGNRYFLHTFRREDSRTIHFQMHPLNGYRFVYFWCSLYERIRQKTSPRYFNHQT